MLSEEVIVRRRHYARKVQVVVYDNVYKNYKNEFISGKSFCYFHIRAYRC